MNYNVDFLGYVDEGTSVFISYTLTDYDKVTEITEVTKLEYSVSDGSSYLIDWVEIVSPDLPSGTIEIPGSINRIDGFIDRYITIHAKYDGGNKDIFKSGRYQLKEYPTVTTTIP